ncbi:IclR family transcriptional regulator [Pseudohoeflea coraliihabitans]|uniref:IclR family transcriptional regulator n=1 Tax=Pseudohoeflea coraliihabitans TaxID=2860393 RepID=A0ABS6WL11_9HYPH|nr:IclR family transcriptional regulator [Pseudohoeflea sp. DP4N28-3]MBW3096631.1 IclR family transcriptional regulator [Pseudohoeflea sp. DP4N28-3]
MPTSPAVQDASASKVQVIDRATEVLTVLSHHPDGLTLTELTEKTGLHKATALRFLKSLEQNGLTEKVGAGKHWGLGPALFDMASRAGRRADLREVARPIMQDISDRLGHTVQLAILGGQEIVYVEKVEPPDLPLKINTQVGSRRPVHCTALGKAICAELDWTVVAAILSAQGMPVHTAQTITQPEAFRRELENVRQAGHAIDDREYNALVFCVAAAVRDARSVIAGLSISVPGLSGEVADQDAIVAAVKAGARQISERLGGHR